MTWQWFYVKSKSMGAFMTKHRRGFSLLETAIAVAIGGLVIGSLWFYLSEATDNNRRELLYKQAIHIITKSREVFGNAAVKPNITTAVAMTQAAVNAGIFPADMVQDGSGIPIDAYGGQSYLGHSSGNPAYFRLSLSNIDQGACTNLLSKMIRDPNVRRQYGIFAVSNSANAGALSSGTPLGTADVPASQITTFCTNNNRLFNITIDFRYN